MSELPRIRELREKKENLYSLIIYIIPDDLQCVQAVVVFDIWSVRDGIMARMWFKYKPFSSAVIKTNIFHKCLYIMAKYKVGDLQPCTLILWRADNADRARTSCPTNTVRPLFIQIAQSYRSGWPDTSDNWVSARLPPVYRRLYCAWLVYIKAKNYYTASQ